MEAVCSSPGGRGEGRPQGNIGCKIIRASWTIKVKIREECMVQEASRPAWAVVTGPQVDPVGGRERERGSGRSHQTRWLERLTGPRAGKRSKPPRPFSGREQGGCWP